MRCQLAQWMISSAIDGDKPLSGWAARHAATCGECGAFERGARRMDERMRLLAGASTRERASQVTVAPRARRWRPAVWVGAGALVAAAGVVAIVMLSRMGQPAGPVNPSPAPVVAGAPRAFVPDAQAAVGRSAEYLQELASASARRELSNLSSDVRAVARNWAACLPPVPTAEQRPRPGTQPPSD